jgi:hypothetical protein
MNTEQALINKDNKYAYYELCLIKEGDRLSFSHFRCEYLTKL